MFNLAGADTIAYFKVLQDQLTHIPYLNSISLTVLLISLYLVIRFFLIQRIAKSEEIEPENKIFALRKIRDYGRIFLLISIFFLWFSQLQTVFISFLAVGAAIVVALKEVIMCITGGLLIRFNKHYKMGDRIEIDGIRGFVIDHRIAVTKILEIGPEKHSQQTTGCIISVPNSVVLSKIVKNESYFQDFSIKSFVFVPHPNVEIEKSEELLLKLGQEACSAYFPRAKHSILKYCKKEGIGIQSVDPRVKWIMTDCGNVKLILKIPVDNKKISDIEQILIKGYKKSVLS